LTLSLPISLAYSDHASDAMVFDRNSSARRLPNVDRMRTVESLKSTVVGVRGFALYLRFASTFAWDKVTVLRPKGRKPVCPAKGSL